MHVVIVCRDAAGSEGARDQALAAHRAYVDAHAPMLVLSGPLLSPSGAKAGQLFILDVPDREAVERFVADDPFTRAQVFAVVTIDELALVFRDGGRL